MDDVETKDSLAERQGSLIRARSLKMLGWMVLIYAGIGIAALSKVESQSALVLLKKFGLPFVGLIVAMVGMLALVTEFRSARHRLSGERFVDVDERSRKEARPDGSISLLNLATRVSELEGRPSSNATPPASAVPAQQVAADFPSYFGNIREVLERKAAVADEKASILLDKGVTYSKFGIFVFVVSIIAWQLVTWKAGFQVQHIYGMASCTILFVFIEFLSAWFLKQYRHFVDTSTYLIKVKSIFDRYMLSYHVAIEFDALDQPERADSQMAAVLTLLRDDIKWPDDYLLKSADVSFAREMLQSMSELAKSARKPAKASALD